MRTLAAPWGWEMCGCCWAPWDRWHVGTGTPLTWPRASSCRGCIVFSSPYAWANFTVLALGVWAVAQRDSVDAISMVRGEAGGTRGTSFG